MKLIFYLVLIFITALSLYGQDKKSIAVIELESNSLSPAEAKIFTNRLRTELFKTGKYIVLERDKMAEILKEQGFQLSGCTTAECAVEAGKLLGMQQMVAGNIGVIGKLITINLRLIDVETGQVINTISQDCECPMETALTEAVKKAAEKLAGKKIVSNNNTDPVQYGGVYYSSYKGFDIYLKLFEDGRAFRQYGGTDITAQAVFITEYDSVTMKGNYSFKGNFIEIDLQAGMDLWRPGRGTEYVITKETYYGRIIDDKLVVTRNHSDNDQTIQLTFEFHPVPAAQ